MRWLLLKDLQILRRSPMLVAILIAYPVVLSVLIGLALSRGPDRPKVAFVNEVPATERTFQVGSQASTRRATRAGCSRRSTRCASTRAQAIAKVRDGEVLGALVVPADVTRRLQDAINLTGSSRRPTLEVVYNVEDPIKAQIVESTIKARLADANQALSGQLTTLAARYLDIITRGGDFSIRQPFDVLGLERSRATLGEAVRLRLPPGLPEAAGVRRVMEFADVAIANLDLSRPVLASVGQPIAVKRTVLEGRNTPLDAFAVAVSVTISLMFVGVLLAAGMLALEREDHAFARLVRGLVSRLGLLGEKVVLSAGCAFAATLAMLCGIGLFVDLDWGRFALWLAALAGGADRLRRDGRRGGRRHPGGPRGVAARVPDRPAHRLPRAGARGCGRRLALRRDARRVGAVPLPARARRARRRAQQRWRAGAALAHLAVLAVAYLAIARAAIARFA